MPATCRLANPAAFPRERQGTVRGCRWHHTRCRRNQASPIRAPCSCPIVAAAATPGRQARAGCPISPLRTERGILFGPLVYKATKISDIISVWLGWNPSGLITSTSGAPTPTAPPWDGQKPTHRFVLVIEGSVGESRIPSARFVEGRVGLLMWRVHNRGALVTSQAKACIDLR
jgi:hypothetical protein